jgi:hypothetical protein
MCALSNPTRFGSEDDMGVPSYREPSDRNEPRPSPDYEAIAAQREAAARQRLRTTLLLAGILGALFVCVRCFRIPAAVAGGFVAIALVPAVVSDVVRLRRD